MLMDRHGLRRSGIFDSFDNYAEYVPYYHLGWRSYRTSFRLNRFEYQNDHSNQELLNPNGIQPATSAALLRVDATEPDSELRVENGTRQCRDNASNRARPAHRGRGALSVLCLGTGSRKQGLQGSNGKISRERSS